VGSNWVKRTPRCGSSEREDKDERQRREYVKSTAMEKKNTNLIVLGEGGDEGKGRRHDEAGITAGLSLDEANREGKSQNSCQHSTSQDKAQTLVTVGVTVLPVVGDAPLNLEREKN